MGKHIKCADCRFARQDVNASEYTQKHCKGCDNRKNCEICSGCEYYDTCKARTNAKLSQGCDRRFENRCSRQTLKWAAIECGCRDSEYYKALLNVTPYGDMEKHITWKGCPFGERGCG